MSVTDYIPPAPPPCMTTSTPVWKICKYLNLHIFLIDYQKIVFDCRFFCVVSEFTGFHHRASDRVYQECWRASPIFTKLYDVVQVDSWLSMKLFAFMGDKGTKLNKCLCKHVYGVTGGLLSSISEDGEPKHLQQRLCELVSSELLSQSYRANVTVASTWSSDLLSVCRASGNPRAGAGLLYVNKTATHNQ